MQQREQDRTEKEKKPSPIGNPGPNRAERRKNIKGGKHSTLEKRLSDARVKT